MSSDVDICNLALALVGAPSIHSITVDSPKESGLCRVFYPMVRDFNLSSYDWSFARKTYKLQQSSEDGMYGPLYPIPSNCLTPLTVVTPCGDEILWEVEGDDISIPHLSTGPQCTDVYLKYTVQQTNAERFSQSFIRLLYTDLAIHLTLPLVNDVKTQERLNNQLKVMRLEVEATDANIGSQDLVPADDPEKDTFVSPPGSRYSRGWGR